MDRTDNSDGDGQATGAGPEAVDGRFAERLATALKLASSAAVLSGPVSHSRLLEMIVQAAAHVISARAASLYLIDREHQELTFEVALGPKAAEVKKFRVPLGHGIAGLVALTGQAMAISDASHDPRQASDISQSIGYTPKTMLCVPLLYGDEIIGVLQLLDKEGGTFTPSDMQALGIFANQAAVAIEQSRAHGNLAALLAQVIRGLPDVPSEEQAVLEQSAASFVAATESRRDYADALSLAKLVHEISGRGPAENELARRILEAFAAYVKHQGEGMGGEQLGALSWSPPVVRGDAG